MNGATSFELPGRVAIVTGAGSRGEGVGIGKAIAVTLARAGARVCLVDIVREQADETQGMIEESGGQSFVTVGDVTSLDDCERFVAETHDRYGRVDVLVNNAAITGGRPPLLEDFPTDVWREVIDVNLNGPMYMSRACLPHLVEAGGGSIVNIASLSGLRATATPAYGASKAGLISLTRDLALTYGRRKVRVNAIAPGSVETPMFLQNLKAEDRALRARLTPLEVAGDAWDVAAATLFLASDAARFISGICLPVDGGASTTAVTLGHRLLQLDG